MAKSYVLSLGGSIIVPAGGIDVAYLKKLKTFITSRIKTGSRFYLVIGGGTTARLYQSAARQVSRFSQKDSDWLGISATRLNARLIKTIFGDVADENIIIDPTKKIKTSKRLVLAAGYKPGWSTDYVAVLMAKQLSIKTVINLSNVDFAYDKDPRKFPEAKKLGQITWPEFRKIVGSKWRPGLSAPFDPIASRAAQKNGMKVIIMNGRNLTNLGNCLQGQKYKGTTIS